MTTHAPPATLAAWLEQQLANDEAVALAAWGDRWTALTLYPDRSVVVTTPATAPASMVTTEHKDDGTVAHIARHDPARVLANVAALRAVIALHVDLHACSFFGPGDKGPEPNPCPTLRALAQPFAGREGWQEAWAS